MFPLILAQTEPSGLQLPEPDLHAVFFFYVNSALTMLVAAGVFVSLGFWLGFLTWARYKRRARAYQEECDILRHEIASLKRRIAEEAAAPPAVLPLGEDLPSAFRLTIPMDARVTVVEETVEDDGAPATGGLNAVLSAKTSAIPTMAQPDEFRSGDGITGGIKVTAKTSRIVVREAGALTDPQGDKTAVLNPTDGIPLDVIRSGAAKTSRVLLIESTSTKPPQPEAEESVRGKTSRMLLIEKVESGPLSPPPVAATPAAPLVVSPAPAVEAVSPAPRAEPVAKQPRSLTSPTLITSAVAPISPDVIGTDRTIRLDPSSLPTPPTVSLSEQVAKVKTSGIVLQSTPNQVTGGVPAPLEAKSASPTPERIKAALPTLPEVPAIAVPTPELNLKTEPQVDSGPYTAEVSSGKGSIHPGVGFVFKRRPDRYDDLTLMRGVNEALQGKLNDLGIYTFRQIALWTADQLSFAATEIGASERSGKDRWQQQSRDLHLLKYGEKL
jgi:hypothetical protein